MTSLAAEVVISKCKAKAVLVLIWLGPTWSGLGVPNEGVLFALRANIVLFAPNNLLLSAMRALCAETCK